MIFERFICILQIIVHNRFMKTSEVSELNDIHVGDYVRTQSEDGFRCVRFGHVVKILTTEWEPAESARLNIPAFEYVFVLDNGVTAGNYDSIQVASDQTP